jgi:hypothetical protein
MKKAVLALCAGLLLAVPAAAKDLSGLVGVGFTNAFSGASGLTSVSARYWVDKQLGIEGLVGFESVNRERGADLNRQVFAARLLLNFVQEDNLHLYGGAGLALLREEFDDDSDSGLGLDLFVGAEFFFQGLPNLGFSSEVGLEISDDGNTTFVGTHGGSFATFGIRYYF